MVQRLELQQLLENIPGVAKVYFQPPSNTLLEYPAIIYNRDDASVDHADNMLYRRSKRYLVTVIDRDPDSQIPDLIAALPLTRFQRHYAANQLNHDIFVIYYKG